MTHLDADSNHYFLDEMGSMAEQAGLTVICHDWEHPRCQQMAIYPPQISTSYIKQQWRSGVLAEIVN